MKDASIIDIETGKVQPKRPMIYKRNCHGIERIKNQIFVAGCDGHDLTSKTSEIFSIDTNEWKKGPSLEYGGKLSLVSVNEVYIYAIGGGDRENTDW